MNQIKKYRYYTVALIVGFLLLIGTEVRDRWNQSLNLFHELQARREMSPENLEARKSELHAREQELVSVLTRNSARYEQSSTGVFEYLNDCARSSGVKFETLVPIPAGSGSRMQESGFKIGIRDDFHNIGKFVNEIENGAMTARLHKVEILKQTENSTNAVIEGSVTIFPH